MVTKRILTSIPVVGENGWIDVQDLPPGTRYPPGSLTVIIGPMSVSYSIADIGGKTKEFPHDTDRYIVAFPRGQRDTPAARAQWAVQMQDGKWLLVEGEQRNVLPREQYMVLGGTGRYGLSQAASGALPQSEGDIVRIPGYRIVAVADMPPEDATLVGGSK